MREFLIAVIRYSDAFHCGQRDPWYTRGCIARMYLKRWYQITDVYAWQKNACIKQSCREDVVRIYNELRAKYSRRNLPSIVSKTP
jgi:hypothetical protein